MSMATAELMIKIDQLRAERDAALAALRTLPCITDVEDEGLAGAIRCGEKYDGHIAKCVNCEARAVLSGQPTQERCSECGLTVNEWGHKDTCSRSENAPAYKADAERLATAIREATGPNHLEMSPAQHRQRLLDALAAHDARTGVQA